MLPRLVRFLFLSMGYGYLHLFFSSRFSATMSLISPAYSCFISSSSAASPIYSLYACPASSIFRCMFLLPYASSCSLKHLFSSSRRWMMLCWVWIFLSLLAKYIFISPCISIFCCVGFFCFSAKQFIKCCAHYIGGVCLCCHNAGEEHCS